MNIKEISFGNFKSLYNTSFEPGKVNVFVGANGSGKSTILEAIGLLSAAMTDRVDASSLQRKGVRLSTPSLYKSRFKSIGRTKLTVALSLEWEEEEKGDIFKLWYLSTEYIGTAWDNSRSESDGAGRFKWRQAGRSIAGYYERTRWRYTFWLFIYGRCVGNDRLGIRYYN